MNFALKECWCSWLPREGMRERGWGIYMEPSKWSRWSSGYPAPALPIALPEVPVGLGLRSRNEVHSRHFRYDHRNFRLDLQSALPMKLPEVPTEDSPRSQRSWMFWKTPVGTADRPIGSSYRNFRWPYRHFRPGDPRDPQKLGPRGISGRNCRWADRHFRY